MQEQHRTIMRITPSRTKSSKLSRRWAIIGITVLFCSLQFSNALSEETSSLWKEEPLVVNRESSNSSSEELTWSVCGTKSPSLLEILVSSNSTDSGNETKSFTAAAAGDSGEVCSVRPKCDEINGCNAPLFCFNFTTTNTTSEDPETLLVSPRELEGIVEDSSAKNVCAIVLFYAPWCTFSVQFARKFNALGRSFRGLPILAVNLAESEPYKYILAYLPVVVFYYSGKTLFRFSLESSFEDLRDLVANITGFQPLPVDLTDPQNEGPVLTERERNDHTFLVISLWWVGVVGLVYAMKSQLLREWYLSCLRTTSRLTHRQ